MKKQIILGILCIAAMPAFAAGRSDAEMLRIARENLALRAPKAVTVKAERLLAKDMLSVYGDENGYVVVSRAKEAPAILGYSDKAFNVAEMPDGLRWWLDKANENLKNGQVNALPMYAEGETVEPLLTTTWAQEDPYNILCPKVASFFGTSPGLTGCVPTAMAQAMKYFNYPAQSVGTGYYSIEGGDYQMARTNTTYKWDQMPDKLSAFSNSTQQNAVAELMRDCGYASKSVYYSAGTGALIYDAGHGLCHNMQYDSLSLRMRTRAYYTDEQWVNMVHSEIRAKRPIVYAANDPDQMAHCFVFDGIDSKGYVHVNWGWSGSANGYFDISTVTGLTPSYPDPYYGGMYSYNFREEQAMIIGLKPQAKPDPDEEYESQFATYDKLQMHFDGDELMIESIPVYNYSCLNFTGLLGLVVQGEDGHAVVLPFFYSGWEDGLAIPYLGGVMFTEEYYAAGTLNEVDMQTPRPDGKYYLYFVSWAEQEMNNGINPRYIRFPQALNQVPGRPNFQVWECNIKGGHWDGGSLKVTTLPGTEEEEEAGIVDMSIANDNIALVYDLDGKLIYAGENPAANVEKGKPVIVKRGAKSEKVIF